MQCRRRLPDIRKNELIDSEFQSEQVFSQGKDSKRGQEQRQCARQEIPW